MATWIVHLRIAENLFNLIPNLDEGQFAIGNTAPDSGIPDENWENFDPPSHVTHFLSTKKEWIGSADLDFFREHLEAISPLHDVKRFSFRLGYFFHLLTDNLWRKNIFRPFREQHADSFDSDPEFVSKMKKDWYGLDLSYVRDHPESIFWRVFVNTQPDACDLDFLPINAVNQQLQYIKDFYKGYEKEIQEFYSPPYIYLTQEEVDKFVDEATLRLYRIYQVLWEKKMLAPDEKSILMIVP